MDRSSTRALVVWQRWLRFYRRAIASLDDELRTLAGLTIEEYDVLHQLVEAGAEGLRMTELAGATLIARSSCTRLVGALVARRLVERSSDPADRRSVRVRLTADGRRVTRRAGAIHLRGIEREFSQHLAPSDVAALARTLDKLGV